jgi:hypothetical protein
MTDTGYVANWTSLAGAAAALGRVRQPLLRYAPLLILAVAWEAAARLHLVSTLALPPLTDVAAAWLDLARSGELLTNATDSLYRAGAGSRLPSLSAPCSASPWRRGVRSTSWRGRWSSCSIRCRSQR